jgi:uncharacterized protein
VARVLGWVEAVDGVDRSPALGAGLEPHAESRTDSVAVSARAGRPENRIRSVCPLGPLWVARTVALMASAVLLHPHPDMGGNQHNNVISALYERLPAIGVTPLRFDFASSDLEQARAQAVAAIEAAGEPVYLLGYSFGGGVAATIDHPGVLAWGLIAPALTLFESVVGPDPRPKFVVAGERDAWFDPEMLTAATATWAATTLAVVAGADHFFGGGGDRQAAELIAGWIAPLLTTE